MEYLKKELNLIGSTIEKKNHDYGNSFAKSINKFGFVAFHTRLFDKTNRLEELMLSGKNAMVEESIDDTLTDIIGYCLLMKQYLNDQKEITDNGE